MNDCSELIAEDAATEPPLSKISVTLFQDTLCRAIAHAEKPAPLANVFCHLDLRKGTTTIGVSLGGMGNCGQGVAALSART